MIVLYAVVPPVTESSLLRTLRGSQVNVLYDVCDVQPGRRVRDVLAFGRVVREIAAEGPALPLRFGTTVDSVRALRELVEMHEVGWARALQRVAGRCELIVHLPLATTAGQAGSGTEFLRRRAAQLHGREAAVGSLISSVGSKLVDHRLLPASNEQRVALLVPDREVDQVRADIARWARSSRHGDVRTTGPWPPFSFCQEVEGERPRS